MIFLIKSYSYLIVSIKSSNLIWLHYEGNHLLNYDFTGITTK